jgi:nucleotide-binding universal stress UspA family protein
MKSAQALKSTRQQCIVVGIGSGSQEALTALRWAADEAQLRRCRLHIVRVWDPAIHAAFYAGADQLPTGEEHESTVREHFAATVRTVFGPRLPENVTTELAEGVPERILIGRSNRADLLVLGESSSRSAAGRSAGPVIRSCLAHARCTVVVAGQCDSQASGAAEAGRSRVS